MITHPAHKEFRPAKVLAVGGLAMVMLWIGSCGGGGGSDAPPAGNTTPVETGRLDDLSIAGLGYQTATLTGTTDDSGGFRYRCPAGCETVTFRLGGITLGSATGANRVLLPEWQAGLNNGVISELTLRRAQLLYALDHNADPTDGVRIEAAVVSALSNRNLNFDSSNFDNDLNSLIQALRNDTSLSASFRAAIAILPRPRVRALLEQAIAKARGVWVERPSFEGSSVSEIRKYVVAVGDGLRIPYTGNSQALRERYPRGLLPAVGAALTVTGGSAAAGWSLGTLTSRGIQLATPRYAAGGEVRDASLLVTPTPPGTPSTATLRLTADAATLQSLTSLTTLSGAGYSGRPTPIGASGSDGARNLTEALQPASPEFDQRGLSPSGLAASSDGGFWGCDQFGPFLFKLDAQGRTVERLGPAGSRGSLPEVNRRLPDILEARQPGLGCAGVATTTSRPDAVWLAAAAVLDVDGRTRERATLLRVLDFDSRTNTSRQYALGIESQELDFNVLDIEALDSTRLLALVRYRTAANQPLQHEIRVWNLATANDISTRLLTQGPNAGRALEYGTRQEVTDSGVNRIDQRLVLRLQDHGWLLPQATGLAQADGRTLFIMAETNGGVSARIEGGDPTLGVSEHQVSADGVITPRSSGNAAAARFLLEPSPFEAREILLWSIELRSAL